MRQIGRRVRDWTSARLKRQPLLSPSQPPVRVEERVLRMKASLAERTPDPTFALDHDLKVVYLNEAAARMHGIDAAQALGEPIDRLLDGGGDAVREALASLRRVGHFEGTLVQRRADGTLLPVLARGAALVGPRGERLGYAWTHREANEREQIEQSLRRQTLLYEQLLTAQSDIGDGVALIEADRIVYANQALADLSGYSRDGLHRLPGLLDLVAPERRRDLAGAIARAGAAAGESTERCETELCASDGSRLAVECLLRAVRPASDSTQLFAIIRNIEHRRRAELARLRLIEEQIARDAAEQSRERAALIAEVSTMLASSLGNDDALAELARLCVPQLGDWCSVWLLDSTLPEGLRCVARAGSDLWRALNGSSAVERANEGSELVRLVANRGESDVVPDLLQVLGDARPVEQLQHFRGLLSMRMRSAIAAPMIARGKVLGVISLAAGGSRRYGWRDVELIEDVARRAGVAIDNASLYHRAQAALRARDEFMETAAHELRTPLSALRLQLDTLRRHVMRGRSSGPEVLAKLDKAQRQADRLGKLVRNLLDLTSIDGSSLRIRPRTTDLAQIVREVVARHEDEASRRACTVALECDERVEGYWDRERLEQIVENLLTNALRYGAGKPVEIAVHARENAVILSVRDHGVGIALEDQQRIFTRFERASHGDEDGLGIGLYITRRLVEAHGGTVDVHSLEGQGATFSVTLPYRAPTSDEDAA